MPRDPRRVAPQFPLYSAPATDGSDKAPLDSPALTGTPTSPTGTTGDTSTQIATDAFVAAAIAAFSASLSLAWSAITGTPTTLAGYGITDAVSKAGGSIVQASAVGVIPMVVKGAASQTADLWQAQDSSGDILARVFASGRLKIGQGTTADAVGKPPIYVELAGTDPSREPMLRLDNTFISTSNFQMRGFGIELGTGGNISVGQVGLVGYGTNGNRVEFIRFQQTTTTGQIRPVQPVFFSNNTVMLTAGETTGGSTVQLLKFDSNNNLVVGPQGGAGSKDEGLVSMITVSGTPSANFIWGVGTGGTGYGTERMRLTNDGKLGLNGVTAPSQIIDIGSGKIVADGSLLTNLPPNALVSAPATSTSAGVAGQWAKDASNVYICVAANTWYKFAATATTF